MKTLIVLLTLSALLLAGANVLVRNDRSPTPEARSVPKVDAETITSDPSAATAHTSTPGAESVPPLQWEKMESTDYKEYIRNLRHVGFPRN